MAHGGRVAALLGLGVLVAATALAQAPAPWPADLPAALDRAAAHLAAGGLVAAEVRGGSVRYFCAGQPSPRPGIPPERLIFEIGSITKVFTSLLLAQAVVEHRVALADPIGNYLPESIGLDPKVAAITLEELATHTSGLPWMPANGRFADFAGRYRMEDLYDFLGRYHPAAAPPRPPLYSNLGPSLLGVILERIYGEPYDDLVQEKISRPLGLADTVVDLSPEQWTRFAPPHDGNRRLRPWSLPAFAGAVGLHSTAADLARFALALMAPGNQPLRPAWELMRQPRDDFPAYEGRIGLGVLIMQRQGETLYWHGGTTAGTRSHLQWSPQSGRALVILQNSDSIAAMNLAVTLYRLKAAGP